MAASNGKRNGRAKAAPDDATAERRWTPTVRKAVLLMAADFVPLDEIARYFGVARRTLVRKCGEEIARGKTELKARAGAQLRDFMFGRPAEYKRGKLVREAVSPSLAAVKFFLKTQARWSETVHVQGTVRHEVSGSVGVEGPSPMGDLRALNVEQLKQLRKIAATMEAAAKGADDGEALEAGRVAGSRGIGSQDGPDGLSGLN